MKRNLHCLASIAAIGVLILPGCSEPHGDSRENTNTTARPDVEAAVRAIIRADNKGDYQAALNCYTDDIIWIPPNAKPIIGKHAIATRYREMFDEFDVRLSQTIESVEISGNTAIAKGITSGTLTAKSDGSTVAVDDDYLMVLRYKSRIGWRISLLMWNKRNPVPNAL